MANYYSVKEASKILSIGVSLVMRRIKRGEIKAFRIGWVWAIPKNQKCFSELIDNKNSSPK